MTGPDPTGTWFHEGYYDMTISFPCTGGRSIYRQNTLGIVNPPYYVYYMANDGVWLMGDTICGNIGKL